MSGSKMGKLLILSVTDHEEHILNKIMELIADEPEFIHLAPSLPQFTALSFLLVLKFG